MHYTDSINGTHIHKESYHACTEEGHHDSLMLTINYFFHVLTLTLTLNHIHWKDSIVIQFHNHQRQVSCMHEDGT